MNARDTPSTTTSPKIGPTERLPAWAYHASAIATAPCAARGDAHDAAPIESIGDGAGHEHQQRGRRELDEAEQAEVELTPGDVEHLLAEHGLAGHRRRRRAERAQQQRDDRAGRVHVRRRVGGTGRVAEVAGHGARTLVVPRNASIEAARRARGRAKLVPCRQRCSTSDRRSRVSTCPTPTSSCTRTSSRPWSPTACSTSCEPGSHGTRITFASTVAISPCRASPRGTVTTTTRTRIRVSSSCRGRGPRRSSRSSRRSRESSRGG